MPNITSPANHHLTIRNRFGNLIAAPVVYVKDLGEGKAEVHIESSFYIEAGRDHPAPHKVKRNGIGFVLMGLNRKQKHR